MTEHPVALVEAIDAIEEDGAASYVVSCSDRIAADEPDVRAFVDPPDRDRLLREAERLSEQFPDERPSLYGVPVGVKDIFRTAGFPTRAGSRLPSETFEGEEATAVSRLRRSGAIVLGKTVTTEFAYFAPGPTRNPHDHDHTPGGSSSGSAAAVAAGMCPLAIGTQTVGSVIRPAAFCGIVGFKPSYERIPTDGVVPFSASADHVGLFTRDVAGASLAASVLCDNWDPVRPDERPVLGLPDGPYLDQASPVARKRIVETIDTLSSAGFRIVRSEAFDDIDEINDRHRAMIAAEMALAHDEWFDKFGDRYSTTTSELIGKGREKAVGTLVDARNGRQTLRDNLHDRMDRTDVDVWVSPAAPGPAPAGIDDTGDPIMNLPWTHAGVPTVTLPSGTVDGLPLGLQCTGRFGAGEALLAWAARIADALDEHE